MVQRSESKLCGLALAIILASLSASGEALAVTEQPDGVYGRLRQDLVLSLEVTGGLALAPGEPRGALAGNFRFRALDTAGFFLGYQAALPTPRYDALALGVELRPLFLGRLFLDLERGPRTLDLFADSFGLELGVAWLRPGAPWGNGSGLALVVGTGVELPLYWADGSGLLARLGLRWLHGTGFDSGTPGGLSGEALLLTLGFVGRLSVRGGLVPTR